MDWKKLILQYGKIALGGALVAIGLQLFLIPNSMVIGGTSGLATIISYLTGLSVGVLIVLLNLPLFLLALRILGRSTVFTALIGVFVTSILVDVFAATGIVVTEDLLLVAVYGGSLVGIGCGLTISANSSVGGTDLAARLIRKKRPDMTMGRLILMIDATIVVMGSFVFGRIEIAMYAVISIFILNRIIDAILYGVNYAKVVYVISDSGPILREILLRELDLGITVLRGEGGYTGKEKMILVCAIKQKTQIAELKRIVYAEDPEAFVIIQEAREVFGRGFGDGKVP